MAAIVHRLREIGTPERPSINTANEDARLVASLRAGHADAPGRLFDRYGLYVERLLYGLLGRDPEVEDLLHEVFAQALEHVARIRDPHSLRGWITRITIFTARSCVRGRTRTRWLVFKAPEDLPEVPAAASEGDVDETVVKGIYRALDQLKPDDRIAFVLHAMHEMSLSETADACRCSIATVKRRIARAKTRFIVLTNRDPVLREASVATDGRPH